MKDVSRGTDPMEDVDMRLKPSEVRIVNAVRKLRKGRISVTKSAEGHIEVDTRQQLEGLHRTESHGQNKGHGNVGRLRG